MKKHITNNLKESAQVISILYLIAIPFSILFLITGPVLIYSSNPADKFFLDLSGFLPFYFFIVYTILRNCIQNLQKAENASELNKITARQKLKNITIVSILAPMLYILISFIAKILFS